MVTVNKILIELVIIKDLGVCLTILIPGSVSFAKLVMMGNTTFYGNDHLALMLSNLTSPGKLMWRV